jgi:hypothetical protein
MVSPRRRTVGDDSTPRSSPFPSGVGGGVITGLFGLRVQLFPSVLVATPSEKPFALLSWPGYHMKKRWPS